MIKKAFKFIGILFVIIILAAIAVPYLFKDKIIEAVKSEINQNVNAKVEFDDVSLSLLKSFPNFNFSLDELSIIGTEKFESQKLLNAQNIEFSIDFMSVVSDERPIEINTVSLVKPEINILILENGLSNYDIVKQNDNPDTESPEDYNFLIQLEKYEIIDGKFVFNDRSSNTYAEIIELNHEGKGKFTQDVFDISTKTNIGSLTAKSDGITYLRNAKGDINLTLNADLTNNKYTIKENEIIINALRLNTEGYVQMFEDNIDIDIKYSAPKNDFKNLLSMIPSAYTSDFKDVDANGTLLLDGLIKGKYIFTNGALPSFLLNLKVENADLKYPDLPLGIKGINTIAKINSPSSDLDKMVIDISNFTMELGNNPFKAKMKLLNPLSDPFVDTEVNGIVDLAELAKAFPIEGLTSLSGVITSNVKAKAKMSSIDNQDYDNVDMTGDLKIENMDYRSESAPPIQISSMLMSFSPNHVKLNQFEAKAGKSDVSANGKIDNILAYFAPEKTMTGDLKVRSTLFDANEWISAEQSDKSTPNNVNLTNEEETQIFDRFDFAVDGQINEILYDVYNLKNTKIVGQITSKDADIRTFETKIGESDFKVDGKVSNIFNYIFENETLKGNINLKSDYINANEFMVETPDSEAEPLEVIPVPENVEFNITTNIGELLYTNIPLKSIKGNIVVANEIATIENGNARTLGGDVTMNGSYNTQNIEEPKFDMDYNVNSLNYQEAFDKLNTFQTLSPIGKFIDGKFNTSFKMSGILGSDMLPNLNSLSANGILETLEGSLKGFKPVEEFANKLNIDFLKSINLKNTKNWFELNNGKVKVKDFNIKTNGIEMIIGGTHGLDTEMAYNVKAKIPRKILQQNNVGQAADKGLSYLQGQASKLGISIDQGEFINIDAVITGTMSNPKIKINLLGSGGEAQILDDIVDNIKKEAIDKVSSVVEDKTGVDIKNIEEEVETVKEDLTAKADAEIAVLMKKTEETIEKLQKEAQKRADQTKAEAKNLSIKAKEEGYKQADALIEKAGSNIFKKKAAEIAAKKLREETDKKAEDIVIKGDSTAQGIIDNADKQANKLQAEADKQAIEIKAKYKSK